MIAQNGFWEKIPAFIKKRGFLSEARRGPASEDPQKAMGARAYTESFVGAERHLFRCGPTPQPPELD